MHPAEQFFRSLYEGQTGFIELRTFAPDTDANRRAVANRIRDFVPVTEGQFDFGRVSVFLRECERYELGAFFGVALRSQRGADEREGTGEHCQVLTAIFVDADFKHLGEDETRRRLESLGLPSSLLVRSGGGLHPYWLLRVPIYLQMPGEMARAKKLLRDFARALAGVVDESVSEPARVLRIPGSKNFKSEYGTPRTVELESASGSRYAVEDIAAKVGASTSTDQGESSHSSFSVPDAVAKGDRHDTMFRSLRSLKLKGFGLESVLAACHKENEAKCHPPIPFGELDAYLRRCWEQKDRPGLRPSPYDKPDQIPPTDTGNAEFFASVAGDLIRFDHGRREWFVFDTHHWLRDRTEHVDRLALDAIRERQRLALEITDDADKKKHVRFALDSESRARRDNLVRLARKIERIAITGDEWDTNPWMLGVQNGVVDLQSGRLRAGEATDFITKVAPVAFDPTARCPRWDRFMEEVFPGRPELGDYLQRVFGYALTGITSEQVFWILYGEGANGKSTMVEALMRDVLGSAYAWTMPFPTATWSDSMTEYQRASLVGQRLVRASEVSRREHLNEKLIKSLTGGEEVNARHPYGKPFQFTPVAKIVLLVNDKPVISDPSHGMWRRVKLVPFLRKFEGAEVDTSLTDTLTAEAEGILAWAVRGCLDWQRDGLRHPDIVQSETAKYQNESDVLSEFIAERCVEGPDAKVGAQAIFDEYRRWCDDRRLADADRLSQKGFGVRLRQRYTAVDGRTVTYRGVGLKSPDFAQRRDEL